jgi:broad specificity phosphatase PhoE
MDTAALLATHLGIGYETAEGLHEHERQTAGYLPGADFDATVERCLALPDTLVFGEETAAQAQSRFTHALERAAERCPQSTLVIVAHGTVIALFAARHLGIDPFPLWQRLALPSFVAFHMPGYRLAAIETDLTLADRVGLCHT